MPQIDGTVTQHEDHDKPATLHQILARGEKFTAQQVLDELSNFAEEFISTPEADLGIGPVKYNITIGKGGIDEKHIDIVNKIVQYEQVLGDSLIKFAGTLFTIACGKENPEGGLLARLRVVIRQQLQE
jgi:hypothetical protein